MSFLANKTALLPEPATLSATDAADPSVMALRRPMPKKVQIWSSLEGI